MRMVNSIFITIDDNQKLMIVMSDNTDDYFITRGFDTVAECWDFARVVAKGFGMDEKYIDSDVFDVVKPTNLVRIK